MTRKDFTSFVAKTLEEVIVLAEDKAGRRLSRRLAFQWLGRPSSSRVAASIVDHIVQRVFVDEDHIFPCVDIGVGEELEDGSLLIVGSVAGYAQRPFGTNWTGREGPFVHVVGYPLLTGNKSPENGMFAFITPELKNVR